MDSMKSDSWFPCYPADLIADTAHLNNHDFGAYWRLLCWYYLKGPPPNDDETLRNVMRVDSSSWVRTKGNVILGLFTLGDDGCWHQKRTDAEISRRDELSQKRQHQTEAARAARSVTTPVTENVTKAVTAVQPQPQPQIQPQQQAHTHTRAGACASPKQFSQDLAVQQLGKAIATLYHRPEGRPSYLENSMLCEIVRREGWKAELKEIQTYRERLPAKEKRFFPQSATSLLSNWQETLDKARVYEPNPQERSKAAKGVTALCAELTKGL